MYAVFPLAYSLILTALYAPLIGMLLALVFRGVSFEFRFKDPKHKAIWDIAFVAGSVAAAFFQGIVLGAFIQGIRVQGRGYAGGWFDWLSPFSIFTGLALIAGYALLAAGWLVMKTDGPLQDRVFRVMKYLWVPVLGAIGVVSLWTPFLNPEIARRWFSMPNFAWQSPVPVLTIVVAGVLYRSIKQRREVIPFLASLALFLIAYFGLGISLFPAIVPPDVTIWDAAAPPQSLRFMLVGTVILLPMILGYTAYAYWVFRGKVKADDGYH